MELALAPEPALASGLEGPGPGRGPGVGADGGFCEEEAEEGPPPRPPREDRGGRGGEGEGGLLVDAKRTVRRPVGSVLRKRACLNILMD